MIENLSAFKRLFPQAAGALAHPVPLGVVAFTGADAQSFLQGQLTCDVREVRPGQARYTGYCTPKGRLLMLGLLARAPGDGDAGFWLVTDATLIPDLIRRLRMYVLRSKVVVSVPDVDLAGFIDLPAGGPLVEDFAATILDDGGLALRYPSADLEHQRVLVVVPCQGGAAPSDAGGASEATAPSLPDPAWRAADVAAGLAWIEPASREVFVPQALDLGRVPGTLSFTKGCFPGQEIVARVHWLGQVKRGLFRVDLGQLPASTATAPGATVHDAGGQPVGEWVGADGDRALASLRLDVATAPGRLGFTVVPALPPAPEAPPAKTPA